MATDIDGFAVLGAIASNPLLFQAARADAVKAARAMAVKQIKLRTLVLDQLRRIRDALGGDSFALIVDGLKDAEVKSLAVRLDRNNPDVKAMDGAGQRRHLLQLCTDRDPAQAAATVKRSRSSKPPRKAPEKGASSGGRTLSSEAMAARSPRRKSSDAQ